MTECETLLLERGTSKLYIELWKKRGTKNVNTSFFSELVYFF